MGRRSHDLIHQILASEGILDTTRYRELADAAKGLARRGRLTRVLRCVYADPGTATGVSTRLRALTAAHPDAVIAGTAAASLTFDTAIVVGDIAAYRQDAEPRAGFTWWRGTIPPELILTVDGVRVTASPLTVLDLIPQLGADVIDTALRAGVSLSSLWEALALTPQRPGNALRRELLVDSRDEPWSALERMIHRMLRGAGMVGWRANRAIRVVDHLYYGDLVWDAARVIVEVDGWEHHGRREAFEADRHRDALLVADGWVVLRFTFDQVETGPDDVLDLIRRTVDARSFGPTTHRPRGRRTVG